MENRMDKKLIIMNNIKEFTICLHCGFDRKVVEYQMNLLKPLEQIYKIHWNNRIDRHPQSYDSYSELINDAVTTSPTEYVILINDRCHPQPHEVKHIVDLLETGYAAATKYSVGFLGVSKELFRKIGFWDERYYGGGFEDDEFVLKLRLHDLAYYESEEGTYDMNWKSPLRPADGDRCIKSEIHFNNKWNKTDTEIRQVLIEEDYNHKYDLGEENADISTNWKTWSESKIGVFFKERMITNFSGPSRTFHFRNENGQQFRKVVSDFINKKN